MDAQPKLRVWHVPQVPGATFYVEVDTVEEGVKLMATLALYDLFQLEHNIKPDFCNMNGLQMWDETLTDRDVEDMDLHDRWVDWYSEEYDDPELYLESMKETK